MSSIPHTPLSKDSRILILGGGTWGTSTSLSLARRGYKNITVLEASPIPSPISAGNDVNKIMEEGAPLPTDTDEEYVWNRMHELSTIAWKTDPVFKPFYHATGIVFAGVGDECFEHVKGYTAGHEDEFVELKTKEDFWGTMPEGVLKGEFPGWRGFWRKEGAGWVFARGALVAAHEEAVGLGVRFVTGDTEGKVVQLIYEYGGLVELVYEKGSVVEWVYEEGSRGSDEGPKPEGKVLGARTADGKTHEADWTILAMGANSDAVFDFEGQLRPTAWVSLSLISNPLCPAYLSPFLHCHSTTIANTTSQTLAHIKLTPEESTIFTNLPVLFCADRGFFIEPTSDTQELKFCDEHPGYINPVPSPHTSTPGPSLHTFAPTPTLISQPFARHEIPLEAELRMRSFLASTIGPEISSRPFSFARICWDTDTSDRQFLISRHPRWEGLVVAAGGSGMGFMMMPVVGKLVSDVLEDCVEEKLRFGLRWRPQSASGGDKERDLWDTNGRFGADGRVMDFRYVQGWTDGRKGVEL